MSYGGCVGNIVRYLDTIYGTQRPPEAPHCPLWPPKTMEWKVVGAKMEQICFLQFLVAFVHR
jgi:hypothetical protein